MATCRDLYLKEVAEKLGGPTADHARKACELLSYFDCAPQSLWYGAQGDNARLRYNQTNQVLTNINTQLKEV
ncbi:hypothetical protein KAR91_41610 [Candidatus Pacearchaeota archaeon]|nr:hypothetical protein [Candidatus Pacearchaeota archaeon]